MSNIFRAKESLLFKQWTTLPIGYWGNNPLGMLELSLSSYEQAAVIDLSWDSEKRGYIENNYLILDTAKSFYLTDLFTIAVIFPACYPIFIVSVKLLERK